MKLMRPLALSLVAAAIVTPAQAEEQKIYVNPFIGFQYFDHDRDLSETATFGVGLEYRFLDSLAVEPVFSRGDADRKGAPGHSSFDDYRMDFLYYFGEPSENWNPYLATGAGHTEFEQLGQGTAGETRMNLGGGFRYNLNDTFSLRADVREFYSLDEEHFDTLASLGFSIAIGVPGTGAEKQMAEQEPQDSDNDGVANPQDRCPGTASGVSVDNSGCEADRDNDGVVNSKDQCANTPPGAEVNSQGCERDSDSDGIFDGKDECPNTEAGAEVDNTGCIGEVEEVKTFTIEIQFPLNQQTIGNKYDSELRQVAEFMDRNPGTTVEIGGHTDSTGTAEYNQQLSEERAQSVADRLVDKLGVSSDRVSSTGYGESRPVATNTTDAGRADNRRVEAKVQIER
jgi:OOP family OmpA-OmpF porin